MSLPSPSLPIIFPQSCHSFTVSSALLIFLYDRNKLLNPTLLNPCVVQWPWLDHFYRDFSFNLYPFSEGWLIIYTPYVIWAPICLFLLSKISVKTLSASPLPLCNLSCHTQFPPSIYAHIFAKWRTVGQAWLVSLGQKVVLAQAEFTDGSLRAMNMLTWIYRGRL